MRMGLGRSVEGVYEPVLVYSRGRAGAKSLWNKQFYVKRCNWGGMDRSRTEAGDAQIYFTTHGSGAFPVLRLRTVVSGERASRSIVNRTTDLWSTVMVASLILADVGSMLVSVKSRGRAVAKRLQNRESYVRQRQLGIRNSSRTKTGDA